ncbi:RpiR family transcriptional regulator [Oceanobacillus zhaokaii]|uniref:RpiR family transcriptional regulator n=1 Tax=Oceanobacillus zhaokaii TaxID=2052660 RepID=A0A345PJ81_9BACI|nr:MurR/RpiR family transcriptional regulator [Oceanobacillus zhaokaii]AXI10061.1 RpiR family transcriptional regulator [Oceanobacillus zhaokaii]
MSHIKGGLVILKEMVNRLPPSEKKIAEYILLNPEESILLTALLLGEKSNTSSAAVIRLCKSLGFSGLQELKIRIAGDLQVESVNEYRDIEPNDGFNNIIQKVTSNTIQTLKETADIMNIKALEKAVSALSTANSIIFFGVGASNIAAKDAEQKFSRINKNAFSFSDVHMAATSVANKGEGDVVVGISFSGNTEEVAKLIKLAKSKQTTTISITKYGNTAVSNYSDIRLYTSAAKEATIRSGATSSRIAQLHIIDILFMSLASVEYEKTVKHLDETRAAISLIKEDF